MFLDQIRRRRGAKNDADTPLAARQKAEASGAARPLHSIFAVARERVFDGEVELDSRKYRFTFAPASAEIKDGKLELTGSFEARGVAGRKRTIGRRATAARGAAGEVATDGSAVKRLDGVRAVLLATQGGIGGTVRRRRQAATGGNANLATSQDRQEQSKSEELKQTPDAPEQPRPSPTSTEFSDEAGFVGVMYLRLAPMDAPRLGLPARMERTQLNVRLAPTDDEARALHFLYSGIVAALYDKQPTPADLRLAAEYLAEMNAAFGS